MIIRVQGERGYI